MAKERSAGQLRVDDGYPVRQRDRVVDPTLHHLPGQAPPLCLVQGGGSTSRLGYRSL
jgi:hypothetical protein